ncbi:spore germination protein [Ectobacillus antri]|uniref:Spore germination protein n=1 Tax=Ectobacillus antri TaxID=2486280 RepID=A0ABT6H7B3_9BACI|nr:spore germination protein [Ectobacillus antri]MDG4657208.1 spore germination protein [Ectobacillus antri]MDG5755221.1 spore germination protein [Ectobacillus antri]
MTNPSTLRLNPKEAIKQQFCKSEDFITKEHKTDREQFEIIYFESLTDIQYLDKYILPKLALHQDQSLKTRLKTFFQAEDVTTKTVDELSDLLFTGNVIFHVNETLLSIRAADFPKRKPEESALESSIRGPKDGFVEDIKTNISLIRRRLNTPSLCLEKYTIGKRSKTKVVLMYIEDVIDERILNEIRSRLNKVELDILTSIYELESYVQDRPFSVFPSMSYTGRPDFIVDALNQGRFALIVDGNPTVTFAPVHILLETKSPEDAYSSYSYVSLERLIRFLGLIISTFLPGLWIAFSSFNIEQIPYTLVATISISRFGLPLSSPLEMFIILMLFELFDEAGIRLPRAIGQTISVLGGLIVGDAAIRAGITSPTMLVVAAITYISSFTLVNPSLSSGITLIRFCILLLSTFLGLFGVVIGYILTVIYLSTISSFGTSYLESVAPLGIKKVIKSFIKAPPQAYKERNTSTSPDDPTRGENNT